MQRILTPTLLKWVDKAQSTYWSRCMTNPPVTSWIYRIPVITELYTLYYVSQNRQRMNICVNTTLSHAASAAAANKKIPRRAKDSLSVALKWQMCWASCMKGYALTASLKGTYQPSNRTFLNTTPLWAVKENKGISLCLSNKRKKKSMSLLEFMPQQHEKCSQISSVCTCMEIQLFRCACWHFGTLSLIYLCIDDKPLVHFMACVCCVMFEAPLVHMLSPRCRSFMVQMNRQDDLSVTLLFGAGGALAGCM